MKPMNPDTIMTAMVQVDILSQDLGQDIVVFSYNQHQYKVAVNITWVYPKQLCFTFGRDAFLIEFH